MLLLLLPPDGGPPRDSPKAATRGVCGDGSASCVPVGEEEVVSDETEKTE